MHGIKQGRFCDGQQSVIFVICVFDGNVLDITRIQSSEPGWTLTAILHKFNFHFWSFDISIHQFAEIYSRILET